MNQNLSQAFNLRVQLVDSQATVDSDAGTNATTDTATNAATDAATDAASNAKVHDHDSTAPVDDKLYDGLN
jgi:hypothetical protein